MSSVGMVLVVWPSRTRWSPQVYWMINSHALPFTSPQLCCWVLHTNKGETEKTNKQAREEDECEGHSSTLSLPPEWLDACVRFSAPGLTTRWAPQFPHNSICAEWIRRCILRGCCSANPTDDCHCCARDRPRSAAQGEEQQGDGMERHAAGQSTTCTRSRRARFASVSWSVQGASVVWLARASGHTSGGRARRRAKQPAARVTVEGRSTGVSPLLLKCVSVCAN